MIESAAYSFHLDNNIRFCPGAVNPIDDGRLSFQHCLGFPFEAGAALEKIQDMILGIGRLVGENSPMPCSQERPVKTCFPIDCLLIK
jgi:hypothetical protein